MVRAFLRCAQCVTSIKGRQEKVLECLFKHVNLFILLHLHVRGNIDLLFINPSLGNANTNRTQKQTLYRQMEINESTEN